MTCRRRRLAACAAAVVVAAAAPGRAQEVRGINLAGAAYSANRIPGAYGRDYLYPRADEVSYFAGKGMNAIRISVLWERLQPRPGGELDGSELGRLGTLVDAAGRAGMLSIIDVHDYGRYRGTPIGQGAVTAATFADLWRRLARRFRSDQRVAFGLMNEPQQRDAAQWAGAEQAAIDAIRGAGAANVVLASGIGWDGAHDFVQINAPAIGALRDPRHRTIIEVHQYFDRDSSGTTADCVGAEQAVDRLTAVTDWARRTGHRLLLGEFGVSRRPDCVAVLGAVAGFLRARRDVWWGWTYWAAGPLWGDYMFSLEPRDGRDRPQMAALLPFLGGR